MVSQNAPVWRPSGPVMVTVGATRSASATVIVNVSVTAAFTPSLAVIVTP